MLGLQPSLLPVCYQYILYLKTRKSALSYWIKRIFIIFVYYCCTHSISFTNSELSAPGTLPLFPLRTTDYGGRSAQYGIPCTVPGCSHGRYMKEATSLWLIPVLLSNVHDLPGWTELNNTSPFHDTADPDKREHPVDRIPSAIVQSQDSRLQHAAVAPALSPGMP